MSFTTSTLSSSLNLNQQQSTSSAFQDAHTLQNVFSSSGYDISDSSLKQLYGLLPRINTGEELQVLWSIVKNILLKFQGYKLHHEYEKIDHGMILKLYIMTENLVKIATNCGMLAFTSGAMLLEVVEFITSYDLDRFEDKIFRASIYSSIGLCFSDSNFIVYCSLHDDSIPKVLKIIENCLIVNHHSGTTLPNCFKSQEFIGILPVSEIFKILEDHARTHKYAVIDYTIFIIQHTEKDDFNPEFFNYLCKKSNQFISVLQRSSYLEPFINAMKMKTSSYPIISQLLTSDDDFSKTQVPCLLRSANDALDYFQARPEFRAIVSKLLETTLATHGIMPINFKVYLAIATKLFILENSIEKYFSTISAYFTKYVPNLPQIYTSGVLQNEDIMCLLKEIKRIRKDGNFKVSDLFMNILDLILQFCLEVPEQLSFNCIPLLKNFVVESILEAKQNVDQLRLITGFLAGRIKAYKSIKRPKVKYLETSEVLQFTKECLKKFNNSQMLQNKVEIYDTNLILEKLDATLFCYDLNKEQTTENLDDCKRYIEKLSEAILGNLPPNAIYLEMNNAADFFDKIFHVSKVLLGINKNYQTTSNMNLWSDTIRLLGNIFKNMKMIHCGSVHDKLVLSRFFLSFRIHPRSRMVGFQRNWEGPTEWSRGTQTEIFLEAVDQKSMGFYLQPLQIPIDNCDFTKITRALWAPIWKNPTLTITQFEEAIASSFGSQDSERRLLVQYDDKDKVNDRYSNLTLSIYYEMLYATNSLMEESHMFVTALGRQGFRQFITIILDLCSIKTLQVIKSQNEDSSDTLDTSEDKSSSAKPSAPSIEELRHLNFQILQQTISYAFLLKSSKDDRLKRFISVCYEQVQELPKNSIRSDLYLTIPDGQAGSFGSRKSVNIHSSSVGSPASNERPDSTPSAGNVAIMTRTSWLKNKAKKRNKPSENRVVGSGGAPMLNTESSNSLWVEVLESILIHESEYFSEEVLLKALANIKTFGTSQNDPQLTIAILSFCLCLGEITIDDESIFQTLSYVAVKDMMLHLIESYIQPRHIDIARPYTKFIVAFTYYVLTVWFLKTKSENRKRLVPSLSLKLKSVVNSFQLTTVPRTDSFKRNFQRNDLRTRRNTNSGSSNTTQDFQRFTTREDSKHQELVRFYKIQGASFLQFIEETCFSETDFFLKRQHLHPVLETCELKKDDHTIPTRIECETFVTENKLVTVTTNLTRNEFVTGKPDDVFQRKISDDSEMDFQETAVFSEVFIRKPNFNKSYLVLESSIAKKYLSLNQKIPQMSTPSTQALMTSSDSDKLQKFSNSKTDRLESEAQSIQDKIAQLQAKLDHINQEIYLRSR